MQEPTEKLPLCAFKVPAYFHIADPLLQLVYILFWGAAVMSTVAYIYHHGQEFINSPKLVQKID